MSIIQCCALMGLLFWFIGAYALHKWLNKHDTYKFRHEHGIYWKNKHYINRER